MFPTSTALAGITPVYVSKLPRVYRSLLSAELTRVCQFDICRLLGGRAGVKEEALVPLRGQPMVAQTNHSTALVRTI